MARSTKHATLICIILTVITLISLAAGYYTHRALIVAIAMLPLVGYEVYRKEGVSTIWASLGMLLMLALLLVLMIGNINFDLMKFLKSAGLPIQSFDIKMVIPAAMAYFAFVLIKRTAGIYTRWLAVVILIACVGLFFLMDPELFKKIAQFGAKEGMDQILKKQ